jgi:hypothetical protein
VPGATYITDMGIGIGTIVNVYDPDTNIYGQYMWLQIGPNQYEWVKVTLGADTGLLSFLGTTQSGVISFIGSTQSGALSMELNV